MAVPSTTESFLFLLFRLLLYVFYLSKPSVVMTKRRSCPRAPPHGHEGSHRHRDERNSRSVLAASGDANLFTCLSSFYSREHPEGPWAELGLPLVTRVPGSWNTGREKHLRITRTVSPSSLRLCAHGSGVEIENSGPWNSHGGKPEQQSRIFLRPRYTLLKQPPLK
ncbi:hypothetical protein F5144DRAFT_358359 [Chaetomium tenue]|uniref:Uncharacterized protein n=1 Tax=Chaetomium tenue TaxID=1854479 RepID=A0ACB7P1A3_9PEZI|nr:hypothetical protein F5144DRAFT_358359 [Chaetomium globosum]